MRAQNKLLVTLSIILLLLVLVTSLSPFLVAHAVALSLRYEARRSGLIISSGEIRAPFSQPIEIQDLRVSRAGRDGTHFELSARRLQVTLRWLALLHATDRTRMVRSLQVEHARVTVHGRAFENAGDFDWQMLGALLPEQFEFSADQIVLDQPPSHLEIQDANVSGNNTRSGALSIASLQIRAPYLQKNFADLHGVTRWQDDRLTIGSLHLLAGLDIDSVALDLARLRATRIATEAALSVFSGVARVNIATENAGNTRLWEAAGSASDISLSQLGAALGLTEPLQGSLRGSKFSFRGDPRDLLHATASLWTELTGFSWRERNADVIMIGANYYERTVQLQELYLKQRTNEFTLSGETALAADWLNPDFRGDVAGSINDLGQFAELFGAAPGIFAGKVAVRGRVHAHERKVDGELAVTGDALKLFRNPVDSLTARITLDSPRAHVDQFEIRRGEDFVRGSGQIDFAHQKQFQLSADSWCHALGEYDFRLPLLGSLSGTLFTQLDANGNETASAFSLAGQTNEAKFSVRGTLRGQIAAFESLTIDMNGAGAAFTGTLSLASPRKLSLTPVGDLRLAQDLQNGVCVRGLELHSADFGTALPPMILTEHELLIGDTPQTPCPDEKTAAQTLAINVRPPPASPSPAMPLPSPTP